MFLPSPTRPSRPSGPTESWFQSAQEKSFVSLTIIIQDLSNVLNQWAVKSPHLSRPAEKNYVSAWRAHESLLCKERVIDCRGEKSFNTEASTGQMKKINSILPVEPFQYCSIGTIFLVIYERVVMQSKCNPKSNTFLCITYLQIIIPEQNTPQQQSLVSGVNTEGFMQL